MNFYFMFIFVFVWGKGGGARQAMVAIMSRKKYQVFVMILPQAKSQE